MLKLKTNMQMCGNSRSPEGDFLLRVDTFPSFSNRNQRRSNLVLLIQTGTRIFAAAVCSKTIYQRICSLQLLTCPACRCRRVFNQSESASVIFFSEPGKFLLDLILLVFDVNVWKTSGTFSHQWFLRIQHGGCCYRTSSERKAGYTITFIPSGSAVVLQFLC